MKCAYCQKEVTSDQYQGLNGKEYDVTINGFDCMVRLHTDCVPKLISAYLSDNKRPVMVKQ